METSSILLNITIILVALLVYYTRKKLNYWKYRGVAHNKPSVISGNFQGVQKRYSISDIITATYNKFKYSGPFCGFYFIHRPAVVVLDKKLLKNVLIKDFNNFTDRGLFHNEEDDPLTGRLFLLDGAKWKKMRSKLSPTFSSGKMKNMFPLIQNVAHELITVLGDLTTVEKTLEIKDLLARFTTDIIGSCAFGLNCNSLRDPKAEFRVMGIRSLTQSRHGKLVSGFIKGFPHLAKKLHMQLTPDEVTNFFMRIVRETVAYRKENNIKTNDFLSILSDLNSETMGKNNEKLSIEQMAAQAFVFFLGGFETSSSTMGFALYELALNEIVQEKLRKEVGQVFEDNMTYESLSELNYMDQVISETLRKYPVVPVITRQALNDYAVPDHPKFIIKKGMPVFLPIYAIHHDPEFYPDPDKFDPERFNAYNVKERDSMEWLPFGDGPRNCIGLRFGLMQTRLGLAYLLQHFKFTVCNKTEIPLEFNKASPLLSTQNGIYLKVECI